MYTLIVIDMQPKFLGDRYQSVRDTVGQEIEDAKKNRADILLVEFVGYGNTIPELSDLTDDYDRCFTVHKSYDDGSMEIQSEIGKYNCMISRFRVVGVNTDYCVRSTVVGLRDRFPTSNIEVVEKGCGSCISHKNGITYIRRLPNVAIV